MSPSPTASDLTELEGAALGVVVRDGPCTSYVVKEMFRSSASEYWSGSAGAIYPLMKRLEGRGLVVSEPGSTGRRQRTLYRATAEGQQAFVRWLSDAERAAGLGFDPLRTRLVFLDQLPESARRDFRATVGAALAAAEVPPPGQGESLARLHRIWIRARRQAFEELFAALDDRVR